MSHLLNLQTLNLPTSLTCAADYVVVRSPLHNDMNRVSSRTLASSTKSLLSARRKAISRDYDLERDTVEELFNDSRSKTTVLRSVSFVRQVQEDNRLEYAVEYSDVPGDKDVAVHVLCPIGEVVDVDGPASDIDSDSEESEVDEMDVDAQMCSSDDVVSLWDPIYSVPWSFEPLSDAATQLQGAAKSITTSSAAFRFNCST